MRLNNVFALDLGTTKFCVTGIKHDESNNTFSIETYSTEARGMYRGMLANFSEAKAQLETLISDSEKFFNVSIDKVIIGVAGSHLKSKIHHTKINIDQKVVNKKLIKKAETLARTESFEDDREILHCMPIKYKIDGRPCLDDPTGLSGKELSATFIVIDADLFYLKDLVKICNQIGLEVSKLVAEPYASSLVTLKDELKKNGVSLLDIGGGTSDGIVFVNEKPIKTYTINVGGILMTKDISLGLNISMDEAERCKQLVDLRNPSQDLIDVQCVSGSDKKVTHKDVLSILIPRIEEYCSLLSAYILPLKSILGGGLVLTGGGSEIKGLDWYLSRKLSSPVQRINPYFIGKLNEESTIVTREEHLITKNATALGLLRIEIDESLKNNKIQLSDDKKSLLNKVLQWIKEMT